MRLTLRLRNEVFAYTIRRALLMPGTLRAVCAKRMKFNCFISLAHVKRTRFTCKCNRRIYDELGLQYRPRVLIGLSRNYNLPISRTNVFAGLTAFRVNHAVIMSIAVPYTLSRLTNDV